MIGPLSLAAALALGAAPDPCGSAPPPAAPRDPALAAVYREVGDAERAAGSTDAAAVAYRAALSHDPGDAAARAGLAAACGQRGDPLAEGIRLMQAGDRGGAIEAFERARRGSDPASAELLEGICQYEAGDDAAAAPLLRSAERDPAHRENARFFLGLIALRAGRSEEAEEMLARSSADPTLAPFVRDVVRSARRAGRLVVSFVAESGWDSNVDLAPDLYGPAARTSDAMGVMTGVAELRPWGESGPFVRGVANWRQQATYDALDMRSLGAAAGWQGGRGGHYWLAEYGYDEREIDRAPYMTAHRVVGAGRLDLGREASAGLTWLTRIETFAPAAYAGYTGTRHLAEADVTWGPGPRTTFVVAGHAGRDLTRDPTLAWWDAGPRVGIRSRVSGTFRVGIDAAVSWRLYDKYDPSIRSRRRDVLLDATALAELDLADRWTGRASLAILRELSDAPQFTYVKVVPMFGIAYTAGLW